MLLMFLAQQIEILHLIEQLKNLFHLNEVQDQINHFSKLQKKIYLIVSLRHQWNKQLKNLLPLKKVILWLSQVIKMDRKKIILRRNKMEN